jgi:hypothetical protein
MPSVVGRQVLDLVPEYRVFGLRDAGAGGLEDLSQVIAAAGQDVAAVGSAGLFVCVNQDQLPIRVELVIWDGAPAEETGDGWARVGEFVVPFPSGDVALGDLGGRAVSGPWLRGRTGDYVVVVWSRGRDEAAERQREMFAETADMSVPEARTYIEREGSGIERYQLWLWPHSPID